MRVYFTTTVARTELIFQEGFTDLYDFGGMRGVWFADRRLDGNEGFAGDVTFCLDVPDRDFERYEWVEDGGGPGYRHVLLPAAVLNRLGGPKVYDHLFAGCSCKQMVQAIRRKEQKGGSGYPSAEEMRSAMEFFDRIGWLTPLKLREGEDRENIASVP
jgi:hypothetical protein